MSTTFPPSPKTPPGWGKDDLASRLLLDITVVRAQWEGLEGDAAYRLVLERIQAFKPSGATP